MILPPPLGDDVKKIHTGLYVYHGVYLRFNRLSPATAWTATYKIASPINENIATDWKLRGLIKTVNDIYYELALECYAEGILDSID